MSTGMNKVMLLGNLGAEPEIRTTNKGQEVANLRLATSESWRDKESGERKENTEWHRVVVFSPPLIELVRNHLHKGSRIMIEGKIVTRKYDDPQTTKPQYRTEIILSGYKSTILFLDNKKAE